MKKMTSLVAVLLTCLLIYPACAATMPSVIESSINMSGAEAPLTVEIMVVSPDSIKDVRVLDNTGNVLTAQKTVSQNQDRTKNYYTLQMHFDTAYQGILTVQTLAANGIWIDSSTTYEVAFDVEHGISIGSDYSSAQRTIRTLKERCNPSSWYSDDQGFTKETALENYTIYISNHSAQNDKVRSLDLVHKVVTREPFDRAYALPSSASQRWSNYVRPSKLGNDLTSGNFTVGGKIFRLGGPFYELLDQSSITPVTQTCFGKTIYVGTGLIGNKVYPHCEAEVSIQIGNDEAYVTIENQTDWILSPETCMVTAVISAEDMVLPGQIQIGTAFETAKQLGEAQGLNCSLDYDSANQVDTLTMTSANYRYYMGVENGKIDYFSIYLE